MDRAARERAARALIAVGGAAAVAGAAGALAAAVDRTDSAGRWRSPAAADAYRAAYAGANRLDGGRENLDEQQHVHRLLCHA